MGPLPKHKALPWFFLSIFNSLTCLKKPVSSKRGRYQPGCTGIFWPAKGTSQPVAISKRLKNPSSTSRRKGTWVQALLWHPTYSLGPNGAGPDLKSQKGLSTGPSPIPAPMLAWNDFAYLECWQCSPIWTVKSRVQVLVTHTQTTIFLVNLL
jgi:hypothetical protein